MTDPHDQPADTLPDGPEGRLRTPTAADVLAEVRDALHLNEHVDGTAIDGWWIDDPDGEDGPDGRIVLTDGARHVTVHIAVTVTDDRDQPPSAPDDDGVAVPEDVLSDVIYCWRLYEAASTVGDQAVRYTALAETMADLTSYHPGWDFNHDTMPWDREGHEFG